MVDKLDKYIPCQLVDVLIFKKRRKKRAFRIHSIFRLIPFFTLEAENGVNGLGLLFAVLAHVPVIAVRNLAVFRAS